MGIFRDRTEGPADSTPTPVVVDLSKPVGKSGPTPSRKEAEHARRERINPTLTPKQARAKQRTASMAARDAVQRAADSQPGKVLLRNWIDTRRGIAGFSMPILMVTLLLSMLSTSLGTVGGAAIVTYVTWGVLLLILIDLFRMWIGYKKLHAQRLPNESTKGLLGYGISRSIQVRRLRMPAATLKPGDTF